MAYLFNLKSKPGLKYEKEEDDGIVDMTDFFNTGENDDAICSYALEFDDDTGVVSFEGEWDKENDEELDGSRPDIFDVEKRIEAFAEFFDVEWEEDSKIIDNGDGDDYEITF